MDDTLNKLGVDLSGKKILIFCMKNVANERLLQESVTLLGRFFRKSLLAKIIMDVEDIIGVDDLSEAEEDFTSFLVEKWQIEDPGAYADSDQGEDDSILRGDEPFLAWPPLADSSFFTDGLGHAFGQT